MPTTADWLRDQAVHALRKGQAAMAADLATQARLWLQRARRIAPQDATIALTLAVCCLRIGAPLEAVAVLEPLCLRHDHREIWLTLVAARDASGDGRAAHDLARALARTVIAAGAGFVRLADRVARASDAPGWCGIDPQGRVVARLVAGDPATLRHNGNPAGEGCAPDVASLSVTLAGRHLLGSPLDLARMRRTEGLVSATPDGLSGWAWLPGNPDRDPLLTIAGGDRAITVLASDTAVSAPYALSRPRAFRVPQAELAGLTGGLHVRGPDGADLAGSPLRPHAEVDFAVLQARAVARAFPADDRPASWDPLVSAPVPAELRGPPACAPQVPTRPVAVVVPVHGAPGPTLACLDSVFATVPPDTVVIVVDDASPQPALVAALDTLQAAGRIVLLRHAANLGFTASANAGLRAAARLPARHDAVLLNSDTLVTPGWLAGLRAGVHAQPDIGTATPLSNDATIMSYPHAGRRNPPVDRAGAARLARLAARENAGVLVEVPTAVGFCMYIRAECLAETGLLRTDLFAQGYGEENDFCLRARHLGWRHMAAAGVYVAHLGGQSFTHAAPLLERNLALLERRHPGYDALIAAHVLADPLAEVRRALDLARFKAARRPGGPATILLTHDAGGGVERVVRARCDALQAAGRHAVVLRPAGAGACVVARGAAADFPNLRFAVPLELKALARLLRAERPDALEVHHLVGHDHAILSLADRLGLPVDHHVHDYALFCPRITLVTGAAQYCGEPENPATCDACIADSGRFDEDSLPVAALRARSRAELTAARRVVAPSADAAARLRRHFAIAPTVVGLSDDADLPPLLARRPGRTRKICVVGGIGPEKGFDVLLACARDAAARRLDLEFVLVGHTPDDVRLLDTGRVFVTGRYDEADGVALVAAQDADLGWLPSIWPETWCFALGVAWQAGLAVAAFDIGAPAERIRATGRGWLLPLGLPPHSVNNALLAVALPASDV